VLRPSVTLAALLLAASAPAKDTWTVLFDGGSTQAWRGYNRDSFPAGDWVVEDGALKTVPRAKEGCDLVTRERYRDFELTLEWKVGPGGNSGILYRAAELPAPTPVWHSAPELQILDDTAHSGGEANALSGALYDLVTPIGKVLRPVGEWNQAGVLVRGNHVEHWLNGKKVLEYELGSAALAARIGQSKFKNMPRFARERKGHVALQHHGEEVWFRDIRIRKP
jgi:hypothetical protein